MARNSPVKPGTGLPVKWAVAVVCLLILYALVQPLANSRLGWKLPSLAVLLGEAEPDSTQTASKDRSSPQSKAPKRESQESSGEDGVEGDSRENPSVEPQKPPRKQVGTEPAKRTEPARTEPAVADDDVPPKSAATEDADLRYGMLREVSRDRYLSPAGLQYGPGSEEGHRLKHLERHLADMPDRPGKHGVFEGDMAQVLKWIDEAYVRGKQGAKGVRSSEEDGRTVYEVPFSKAIGYVGGRDGGKMRHPPAKQIRLVVQGKSFITAFPF